MIDIGICTNSAYYIELALNNIIRTSDNIDNLNIILAINDRRFDVGTIKDKFFDKIKIEYRFIDTPDLPLSSYRHGVVLNELISYMNNEYGMFLDQDVAFLMKGWDTIMINELNKDKVQAVGVEHSNKQKYLNFPCIVMSMFRNQLIKDLQVDFRPYQPHSNHYSSCHYKVQTAEQAKCWSKRIGEDTILDTGCNFPIAVVGAGYSGIVFPYKGSGVLGVGQENHFMGKPITSHKKASSFLEDKTPIDPVTWSNIVDKYLKQINL